MVTVNLAPRAERWQRWQVLRAWRRELGLTLTEVACGLGIGTSAVSRRENISQHRRHAAKKKEWTRNNNARVSANGQRWRADNAESVRRYNRDYSQTHRSERKAYNSDPNVFLRRLACNARDRAKAKGAPYDWNALQRLIATPPRNCACCAVVLDYRWGKGRKNKDRSPSIDRHANALGYVANNIAIICLRCNYLKRDATCDEVRTLLRYMERDL